MSLALAPIDFELPTENVATEPAELRGKSRADVRLMVVRKRQGTITNSLFPGLGHHLEPGDVLVVNTSATLPAAVPATEPRGMLVHFASPLRAGLWSVELRRATGDGGSAPLREIGRPVIALPDGVTVDLLAHHQDSIRLWAAAIDGTDDVVKYLDEYGAPIRYVAGDPVPLAAYQTIFAGEPGSAEMPSAGRPFTDRMVTELIGMGITIVPIVLHSGVSSYEIGETPSDERYVVPEHTATVVNALRSAGGRVIAVGTTVVRALETVVDRRGFLHPGSGSTDVLITDRTVVKGVDGLLTGWHEPRSSHLSLLEAFLDRRTLGRVYDEAISAGYKWHEFGDSMLILP